MFLQDDAPADNSRQVRQYRSDFLETGLEPPVMFLANAIPGLNPSGLLHMEFC